MSDESMEAQVNAVPDPEDEASFKTVYSMPNPEPDNAGTIPVIAKKDGKEAQVFYNYGNNLAEMIELFGETVVFSNARGKMVIGLQAAMRSRLKTGQDIGKLMDSYKPGVALERIPVDMNKATEDYFSGLSSEEQDAMITRLMNQKD